jgi:hypothetical protein
MGWPFLYDVQKCHNFLYMIVFNWYSLLLCRSSFRSFFLKRQAKYIFVVFKGDWHFWLPAMKFALLCWSFLNTFYLQNKCIKYWPDDTEESFGSFKICLKNVETHSQFDIRTLSVKKVMSSYNNNLNSLFNNIECLERQLD